MGNKNTKIEEKVEKMPALDKLNFIVKYNAGNLLLHEKSEGYQKRFTSWSKNTNGEHLDNLTEALLSSIAQVMVTGQPTHMFKNVSVDALRGNANGIIAMSEFIRVYASDSEPSQEDSDLEIYKSIMGLD